MDPNAALKELREQYESDEPDIDVTDTEAELASRFVALDLWITAGGFLPKPWEEV